MDRVRPINQYVFPKKGNQGPWLMHRPGKFACVMVAITLALWIFSTLFVTFVHLTLSY